MKRTLSQHQDGERTVTQNSYTQAALLAKGGWAHLTRELREVEDHRDQKMTCGTLRSGYRSTVDDAQRRTRLCRSTGHWSACPCRGRQHMDEGRE